MIVLQSDIPAASSIVEIIKAVGSVLSILITAASPFIIMWIKGRMDNVDNTTKDTNVKMAAVAIKVDGLLEQKTLADKALGRIEGIDTAAKEKAIGDARELQSLKEQQLLNQTPPNRDTTSDVKEIVKAVETKADETQEVVKKIPEEVVKKLPP